MVGRDGFGCCSGAIPGELTIGEVPRPPPVTFETVFEGGMVSVAVESVVGGITFCFCCSSCDKDCCMDWLTCCCSVCFSCSLTMASARSDASTTSWPGGIFSSCADTAASEKCSTSRPASVCLLPLASRLYCPHLRPSVLWGCFNHSCMDRVLSSMIGFGATLAPRATLLFPDFGIISDGFSRSDVTDLSKQKGDCAMFCASQNTKYLRFSQTVSLKYMKMK